MHSFTRCPAAVGTVLAVISIVAGAAALVAADFGYSGWVFVPLLLWLATIGLPSTTAVLVTASFWGSMAPLYGLIPFLLTAGALSICAQVVSVRIVRNLRERTP